MTQPMPQPVAPEVRARALAAAVQAEVSKGARVDSQSPYQAVLVHGRPVNHVLHLILTLVTCLAWGLVWLALVVFGGEKRISVTVDDYGVARRAKL